MEYYELSKAQKNYKKTKQAADVAVCFMAVLFLWPLFLVISVSVKLEEGFRAPVFFMQKRVGENGTYFRLIKFRTMRLDTPHDMPTHLLADPEQYVTKTGRFLRKTSLDELPQLFNILKGEMSIIGPRPALWNQDDLIEAREQYGVQQLRPGLTGWAQVNGRDMISISKKAALDAYYLRHFGLLMDLRCFFKSIFAVLTREDIAG